MTPFNRFIVEFLDIEPTFEDGINFGEWLHCVSTVCLFEREEMVRMHGCVGFYLSLRFPSTTGLNERL